MHSKRLPELQALNPKPDTSPEEPVGPYIPMYILRWGLVKVKVQLFVNAVILLKSFRTSAHYESLYNLSVYFILLVVFHCILHAWSNTSKSLHNRT